MTRPGKRKATDQAIGPERTAPTLNTYVIQPTELCTRTKRKVIVESS